MTFRSRWLSVLLAIFSIFSLSVFAVTALAVWFSADAQAQNLDDPQAGVVEDLVGVTDDPAVLVSPVDVPTLELDHAVTSGQAVFQRTSMGDLPDFERAEPNSLIETTRPVEVATPAKDEAIVAVDDLSITALRETINRFPSPTATSESPPDSPFLPDSPSPQVDEPQAVIAPTTEAPVVDPVPPPESEPQINGLPLSAFLIIPDNVAINARSIIARGKELGRNPRAYSKVGDSTIENPNFMTRFDDGPYNLGNYNYLKSVIEYYSGSHSRQGIAVQRGMHSWSVNDPLWADNRYCQPNETPLACEIRLHNPSILFIRLGSNDSGTPGGFEKNIRQAVEFAIEMGVLPILGTKADRFEGSDINNQIIRQVAAETQVPLWDFDRVAMTLPDRGLQSDGVHLTIYYAHDYTSPTAYQRGHGLHNLSALLVLDKVWRELFSSGN